MKLESISKKVIKFNLESKEAEDSLAKWRQKFFDAATAEVAAKPRATKIVEYTGKGHMTKDYIGWIKEHHPGFILHSVDVYRNAAGAAIDKELRVRLALIEDPAKKKFTFTDVKNGKKIVRNFMERASLDDEALARDYPDVWERISKPVEPPPREIDYDNISPEDQLVMEKYIVRDIKPRLEIKDLDEDDD